MYVATYVLAMDKMPTVQDMLDAWKLNLKKYIKKKSTLFENNNMVNSLRKVIAELDKIIVNNGHVISIDIEQAIVSSSHAFIKNIDFIIYNGTTIPVFIENKETYVKKNMPIRFACAALSDVLQENIDMYIVINIPSNDESIATFHIFK